MRVSAQPMRRMHPVIGRINFGQYRTNSFERYCP